MPVPFVCASCGYKTRVKEELQGKRIKCPKCQTPGVIGASAEAEEERPDSVAELASLKLDKYSDVEPTEEELAEEESRKKAPKKKKSRKKKSNEPALPGGVVAAAAFFSLVSVGVLALMGMTVIPEMLQEASEGASAPAEADADE